MSKAESAKICVFKIMKSPVGGLKLVGSDRGLAAVLWENDDPGRVRLNIAGEDGNHPILVEAERQLEEYFAGTRRTFSVKLDSPLPVELDGGARGEAKKFAVRVVPAAITVRVPR